MIEQKRLLTAIFPPRQTRIRRFYVTPPVATDLFIPPMHEDFPEFARVDEEARMAAFAEARRSSAWLERAGYDVESDVAIGSPVVETLRDMTAWKADVTLLRVSRSETSPERIGGMAAALAHHGATPILFHREVPEGYRVRRIVMPTDFSDASRASTDWGLALARLAGAEAHLLHVLTPRGARGPARDRLVAIGTEEMLRWRRGFDSIPRPPETDAHVVSAESAADGILEFVRQQEIDLIVLAGTGKSALSAFILGSNARGVLRRSPVPILLVPAGLCATPSVFLAKMTRNAPPETMLDLPVGTATLPERARPTA
ncbi:MAG TPA: universal stress protein [Thermoanaerobaculia bacterium]|nr:universal stress protein [Thermoanaerobaculia bacterium]